MDDGYSSPMVCAVTGVPPSTLNYWAKTGVVTPSLRGPAGRRATQWWSLADLVTVRSIKALREAGCPLQTLRLAQGVIAGAWTAGSRDPVLHWDGTDLLAVGTFGDVHSLVRHPGQGVLHVMALPIGRWKAELAVLAVPIDAEELARRDEKRSSRPALPRPAAAS